MFAHKKDNISLAQPTGRVWQSVQYCCAWQPGKHSVLVTLLQLFPLSAYEAALCTTEHHKVKTSC